MIREVPMTMWAVPSGDMGGTNDDVGGTEW